jgi:hypothetical protein
LTPGAELESARSNELIEVTAVSISASAGK